MKISSLGYCIKQGFKIYIETGCSRLLRLRQFRHVFSFRHIFLCSQECGLYGYGGGKEYLPYGFFDVGVGSARIESIGKTIQQMDSVTLIEYTSPEEAWEKYKVKYFGDRMDLAEGFEEDNPLADSASYTVYLNTADTLTTVAANIER